jgi:hypothetical protein
LISASLLKDGSGLVITQPTAPSFMFDRESVELMYISEDPSVEMSIAMVRGHTVAANTIFVNPIRQTKKITVFFPSGMKCRKGPFNNTDDDLLTNNVSVVEGSLFAGKQFINAAVYWKLVVDRAEKRATALSSAPSTGEDAIVAACKRMSIKKR